ncbi:PREDICTED: LOW QUALITY PROTEIN: NEDD4-binding protein 2 [Nanorana parkeri]|uniref:LOW QUALITY PROTEIN: NEDD4-binding protein 2 n=1 Tax=Nanorana parkeri TaxID=125878 RepID=UPI000853FC9B|nr:PREDICTED: LOW QUALITY PROTEIN: NEDD4-binding protein 2 [Nanorana parkeri]
MPRKRKSFSVSPQKKTSSPSIPVALSSSATHPLSTKKMSNKKKEMLRSMCEMFPNLEPSLVEMVLSEYTEIEVVMDYLLELSTVAKGESQLELTGFEKITAYLDGFHINSHNPENEDTVTDKEDDYLDDSCIDEPACNDLDMLLDEALDRYGLTNPEDIYSTVQSESLVSEASTSGIVSQQVQSASPGNTSFHTKYMETITPPQMSLATAEDLHLCDSPHAVTISSTSSVQPEVTKLEMTEAGFKTLPEPIDILFQNDKIGTSSSQGHFASSEIPAVQKLEQENIQSVLTAKSNVPRASPKSQIKWNPLASTFFPSSNQQGSFITPVVAKPVQWPYAATIQPNGILYNAQVPSACVWNPFPQTHWTAVKPMHVPKPKPQLSAQIPKNMTRLVGKVLILLRGAPGSGKSTMARMLLEQNPTGVILSTDDYFCQNGQYQYDVNCLSEAHDWNQNRAKDAFEKNVSPIMIDNTNLQGWEMKPYVSMAMKYKYKVTFREPDTWWKYKPRELERRNNHGVKKEKIIKMLENFDRVTVNSILNLSAAKKPESAGIGQLKPDERNGPSNNLVTEVDLATTEAKIPSNLEAAAANADESNILHEARNVPEISLNVLESRKENLKNTDDELETYSDDDQCLEDISIENRPYSIKNVSTEICAQEVITDEEVNLDVGCNSSQMDERNDPLSFVGDWPVEQTLTQRAPRNRKKAKANYMSVQHLAEEEETLDCNLEQIVVNPEPAPKEEVASLKTNFETEASVVSHCDGTDLQKLENQLYAIPAYINNENKALAEHKASASGVTSSEVLQKDLPVAVENINLDISSVTADVEVMTRPSKSSSKKCHLALTFSNTCSNSFRTDGTVSPCNLIEAVDHSSAGIIACTQTEPHEFAIAWRVEKRNMEVLESLKVLTGKADRFKSQPLQTNEYSQENIPYRMMHHKSTFVAEDDIICLQDEDSLQILCKLFRSLSFDVLKDLFERCNKDLEWATNLLLDSGEKIYKDECDQEELLKPEEENCEHLQNDGHLEEGTIYPDGSLPTDSELTEEPSAEFKLNDNSIEDSSGIALVNCTPINNVSLVVADELKNSNVLSSAEVNGIANQCMILDSVQPDQDTVPDTTEAHIMWSSSLEGGQFNSQDSTVNMNIETNNILNEKTIKKESIQEFNSPIDEVLYETGDSQGDIPTDDLYKDQENTDVLPGIVEKPQNNSFSQPKEPLKFDYLELSLPPELAFQLTELFGPVGIDPGSLTIEDCLVPIDLKLAEAIHKKWKQSIMERHNQEALSYQLLLGDFSTNDHIILDSLLQEQESRLAGHNLVVTQREKDMFPFLDQWNTRTKKVSLRQIMSEEMALQAREDLKKPLASTNCAVKMKEKQLLELFPNLEQNLLMDIFKENNYSLEKTEQFISSALEADPVQNVVAPGFKQEVPPSTDRTKEKRAKADKEDLSERYFQDLEYPEYDDFRAAAILYHKKQQESYRKAAEAHNRGMQQVATFYAQQGYLYGQKMKEENRRAAVQIFERANEFLLPENILDLHGLHVDEAMKHFRRVLQEKTEDYRQNGGSPHLLLITGRGNRSQGGVPRIKPAIVDYLTNHDYRFQEKTPGALRITLK